MKDFISGFLVMLAIAVFGSIGWVTFTQGARSVEPDLPDQVTLEMIVGADTCYAEIDRARLEHDAATKRVMRFTCKTERGR